jgi:antitoxin HicB
MKKINEKYLGSNFDDFLDEKDILSDVISLSHKQILAMQIKTAMLKMKISKVDMAKKMHTSRSAVDRLLNPNNPNVTLDTIDRAASALGMNLTISLVQTNPS